MVDAYANDTGETYEFHDLCLWLEREHEWLFTAQFEGVTIIAATNPDPTPEEIIDELLHKAKEVRSYPSRGVARRMIEMNDNDQS